MELDEIEAQIRAAKEENLLLARQTIAAKKRAKEAKTRIEAAKTRIEKANAIIAAKQQATEHKEAQQGLLSRFRRWIKRIVSARLYKKMVMLFLIHPPNKRYCV
jgi:hypothetical protein